MATLKTRLILRNDVTAKWADVVLLKGEAGVEWYTGTGDSNGNQVKDNGETAAKPKIKIGDGFTAWKNLPYIQDGFISTTIGTSGTGNTVVGASVTYNATTGIYSITLTKANRVVDIEVEDDGVVDLSVTPNWNEVDDTNKGHKITASHATQGPNNAADTTSASNANVSINPKVGGTLSVPQITVNKYGHTTAITDQVVSVAGHDITVTNDGNTSGNTIISIAKGDNHEVKYKKGNRLTGSGLTKDTILLGNDGYDVKTSSKTIETTLTDDSTKVPTSKAVYTKIQDVLKIANAAMTLVGTLGDTASGATHTSLGTATEAQLGDAYKVIKAGTYGGITAKVGDLIVCYTPTSGTYAWILIPSGDDIEDTWRAIKVNGTEEFASGITTGAVDFIDGNGIDITFEGNGQIKFTAVADEIIDPNAYDYRAGTGLTRVENDDGSHTFNHSNVVEKGTASGTNSATVQDLGATITLPSVTYDTEGHITKKETTSFVLPDAAKVQGAVKGYGKITVGVNSAVATNPTNYASAVTLEAIKHNEKVTISPSNKWIRLNATNNGTGDSDIMTIGHIVPSALTSGIYGQSSDKTLIWKELTDAADVNTFTVVNPTVDEAGHITSISNITITIPNDLVTTSRRGLAPKAETNSFLVTTNNATQASWQKVLIIDGGSATTSATEWGTIS